MEVAMEIHHHPSKEEVRDWMRDVVATHKPPPDPEVIRSQLWPIEERERRALAS